MPVHLGYERHAPKGRPGITLATEDGKWLTTGTADLKLKTPGDRPRIFDPVLLRGSGGLRGSVRFSV